VQPIHRQSINQNKDDPMKPFLFRIAMLCFLSVLGISMAAAQALDCPALFQEALAAARTNCEDVSRNEACLAYGSLSTDAGELSEAGERIDLTEVSELTQSAENGWGLTVMRLQLNQPDETEDLNSVVMLLGDVTLTADELIAGPPSAREEYLGEEPPVSAPLSAFDFTSNAEGLCGEVLPSGILIQSPNLTPEDEGFLPTQIQINDRRFTLGSTVLINTDAEGGTVAEVLEHYTSVSGEDGEALVLAGEAIELPADVPFVGNEDGSIVVVGSDGQQPVDEGSTWDFLDDLLGDDTVANRPVPPPAENGGGVVLNNASGWTNTVEVFTDGFWRYGVGESTYFGECLGIELPSFEEIITLDERVNYDADGSLLGFIYPVMGTETVIPFEQYGANWYLAEDRMGIVTTLIDLEVATPFFMFGSISGVVGDGVNICVTETPILLESCIVDAFYGTTNGNGLCPASVHDAMGTR
jgi:hypothetical protein